jgi:hypothetical protein
MGAKECVLVLPTPFTLETPLVIGAPLPVDVTQSVLPTNINEFPCWFQVVSCLYLFRKYTNFLSSRSFIMPLYIGTSNKFSCNFNKIGWSGSYYETRMRGTVSCKL